MDLLLKYRILKQKLDAYAREHPMDKELANDFENFEASLIEHFKNLEETPDKFKMLFDNAGDSIFIHCEDGNILSANKTACTNYQYTLTEFQSLTVLNIDAPEQNIYAKDRIEQLMKCGNIYFESIHKRKNGTTFYVGVNAKKIIWNGKNAVLSICRDITERKNTERIISETEIRFKKIIEQIRDGIIIFDNEGKVILWNSGAEKITGVKAENAINRKISDVQYEILHGKHKNRELLDQKFNEVITLSNPNIFNSLFENEFFLEDCGVRIIQGIVFPIVFSAENYVFGSVIRDITNKKNNETQLLKLNADKDRFMQILAHDLRSPFNTLLGFSNLLLKNLHQYNIQKVESQLTINKNIIQKTYNLLDDLLIWSKAQSSKFPFNPHEILLEEIYTDIAESLKEDLNAKKITISFFEEEKSFIMADPNMLKIVLRNLITNAIKFTHIGGTISIFTHKTNGQFILTVADNGVGLSDDNQKKMWDIATQYTTKGTEGEQGTGLGLIICKDFVEKHGGKIRVESALGKGSEFIISLPLKH